MLLAKIWGRIVSIIVAQAKNYPNALQTDGHKLSIASHLAEPSLSSLSFVYSGRHRIKLNALKLEMCYYTKLPNVRCVN